MHDAIADVELLLSAPETDVAALYDRAAARYDHFRDLWLRLAGAPAEQALIDDLRSVLRPGSRVLDAGCGTGALAREVLLIEPTAQLTLLDLSPVMLARAADLPGDHVVGSVLELPFTDDTFDIVISGWVIETVPDAIAAVREYLRVINPDGYVLYTFCSLPNGFLSRAGSAWLRAAVGRSFAGDFIPEKRTPWHDCDRSHRLHAHGGLVTEVSLRKCCHVGAPVVPATGIPGASQDCDAAGQSELHAAGTRREEGPGEHRKSR
ncbi:MAG: class I SAM-dependent methyltransferase [Solirubrobacteraceae bacterium]